MRHALLFLALTLPQAALCESAMCEYRHPAHPKWDFFTRCDVAVTQEEGGELRQVNVSNGSKFTMRTGDAPTVNDMAAETVTREGSHCLRTLADRELVCVHPADAKPPARTIPTVASSVADAGFGGGQKGFCLLSEGRGALARLTEYGVCVKRENCLVSEASGAETCLTEYVWASGRHTNTARSAEWQTLEGASATRRADGCLVDEGRGDTLCFSPRAMSADDHPILATAPE